MKESLLIFISIVGSTIKDNGTILLIEIYLGLESVAYFDLALKIINVLLTPFHMISQVLYPHMAKTKDIFLFNKILLGTIILSIITVILFLLNIDFILYLFYDKINIVTKDTMSILIYIIPIGIISFLLGDNILLIFNKTKWTTYSMIFALFFSLFFFILMDKDKLDMFIYLYVSFFLVEMVIRIYASKNIIFKKEKNA